MTGRLAPARPALPDGGKLWSNGAAAPPGRLCR